MFIYTHIICGSQCRHSLGDKYCVILSTSILRISPRKHWLSALPLLKYCAAVSRQGWWWAGPPDFPRHHTAITEAVLSHTEVQAQKLLLQLAPQNVSSQSQWGQESARNKRQLVDKKKMKINYTKLLKCFIKNQGHDNQIVMKILLWNI